MASTFIILLILFAILSMGASLMLPQANVAEGFNNKCTKPTEIDGDCRMVFANMDTKKIIKECRGKPASGSYETDCPYAYLVDNSNPPKVCDVKPDYLKYIRKNGKMPDCSSHNLGPGGTPPPTLGPGGTPTPNLGPGGTPPPNLGPGGTPPPNLGPGGTHGSKPKPHSKHSHGRRVPDNMKHSKYKKFMPSHLDELPVTKEMYEEIGKNFIRDEASIKGTSLPYIHDSEAEVLGRMVWRVYVAEMDQKLANSPKAADEVMQREIQLLDRVSTIMKSETDHHKGKKHQSLATQASTIPGCNPLHHPSRRTTNQFGYRPSSGHNIKREEGHAFEGHPIHGSPRYYEMSNAVEHCFNDRACGGINFDSTTGEYTLMPLHARIIRKPHYTALIKKRHERPQHPKSHHSKHHDHQHKHHHHHHSKDPADDSPYVPITGIGYSGNQLCKGGNPLDPNTLPRPYNSIMDVF